MKKLVTKIEYIWDMYFAWLFYNGNKQHLYYQFINKKYGNMGQQHVTLNIGEDGLVKSIGHDMGGSYEVKNDNKKSKKKRNIEDEYELGGSE